MPKLVRMFRFVYTAEQHLQQDVGKKFKELPAPPTCWVVLAKPKIGVSTAEVYGGLKGGRPGTSRYKTNDSAIETDDYELLCASIGNVLETVTFKLHPEVVMIKEQMQRFGADAVH